jgi:competence protein ComEA
MSSYLGKYWLLIVILLLVSIVCGGIVLAIKQSSHKPVEISISQADSPKYNGEVYVGGAVANPGFYPLKEGDSLEDIIQAAGPLTEADLSHIEIQVPNAGEAHPTQKISLNHADVWLLAALPGIGQGKAQAIVDYRKQHGHFIRIEDLLNVEGIGTTTIERIRALITVED